jgi:hypothetical protein
VSEVLEAVVVRHLPSDAMQSIARADSTFQTERMTTIPLDGLSLVYQATPNRRNFGDKGETLAAILSQLCEEAVLVRYDSGTCYRYSALYRGGKLVHQYTLADELWIPLDSEGNPVRNRSARCEQ